MKKLLIFSFLVFVSSLNIFAQTTIVSVSNGNWYNPTTWSCTCLPTQGDQVTINHHVTLNNDLGYNAGTLIIGSNGSLKTDASGRNIWVYGTGKLTNNGYLELKYLLYEGSEAFTNNDSLKLRSFRNTSNFTNNGIIVSIDSFHSESTLRNTGYINVSTFLNSDSLFNEGVFANVDSLTNEGFLHNFENGKIQADSILNTGIINNEGNIYVHEISNTGNFNNTDTLTFRNLTNTGIFNNFPYAYIKGTKNFLNTGDFFNNLNAKLLIDNNFYNLDDSQYNAYFLNNGLVTIDSSFYNQDTISGNANGKFIVQKFSFNGGKMLGNFDFCDLTMDNTFAPFIDVNWGTVASQVTYCVVSATQKLSETNIKTRISPNPATDFVTVNLEETNFNLKIYTILGEEIINQNNNKIIDIQSLKTGIYLVYIQTKNQIHSTKLIKE